jgi:transposase-like protein
MEDMGNIKRFHPASFKTKVALELIKGADTISAICSKYSIHPTQAGRWKEQALQGLETIFSEQRKNSLREKDILIEELYKQIGQLKVELDWLKKKSGLAS